MHNKKNFDIIYLIDHLINIEEIERLFNMNKKLKTVSLGLLGLAMFSFTAPSFSRVAYANEVTSTVSTVKNNFKDLSEDSMLLLLKAIDSIPQDMLERGNQSEIDQYMLSKGIDLKFDGEIQERSFWGCVGAVTWAVGTTAVGIGLLAKVKNFIAAAGGVQAAATALMAIARGGFSSENINRFGIALIETGSAILGIKQIKDECFG